MCWRHLLASLAIIRVTSIWSVGRLAGVRLLRVRELVVTDWCLVGVVELRLMRRGGGRTRCTMRVCAGVGVANARVAVLLAIVEARHGVASHSALTRRTGFRAATKGHTRSRVVAGSTSIGAAPLAVAISRHTLSLGTKVLRKRRREQ